MYAFLYSFLRSFILYKRFNSSSSIISAGPSSSSRISSSSIPPLRPRSGDLFFSRFLSSSPFTASRDRLAVLHCSVKSRTSNLIRLSSLRLSIIDYSRWSPVSSFLNSKNAYYFEIGALKLAFFCFVREFSKRVLSSSAFPSRSSNE